MVSNRTGRAGDEFVIERERERQVPVHIKSKPLARLIGQPGRGLTNRREMTAHRTSAPLLVDHGGTANDGWAAKALEMLPDLGRPQVPARAVAGAKE